MSNTNSYCDYIFKHYWKELAGIVTDITVTAAEEHGVGYVDVSVGWRMPGGRFGELEHYGPGHPSSTFLLINERAIIRSQYIEDD